MTNEMPKNIWLDRLDSMRDDCEIIPAYRNKDIGVPVDAYNNTTMLIKEIKAMKVDISIDKAIDIKTKYTIRKTLQDVIDRLEEGLCR